MVYIYLCIRCFIYDCAKYNEMFNVLQCFESIIFLKYLDTYQLMTVFMVYIIFRINKSENKILKSHQPAVLPFQKVTGQLFASQLSTSQLSKHL